MALSYRNFRKAKEILEDVAKVGDSFLPGYDVKSKKEAWLTGRLQWEGEKEDGGKECVWTVIDKPSEAQIETFERRKTELYNSSFVKRNGSLVMFGWF